MRTAYRVHGGASARTRDAYIYISGDEVVHTASIMYEPNAYQASQQLDTMESVRERSRAISKLADSGHTVRGYIHNKTRFNYDLRGILVKFFKHSVPQNHQNEV